MLFVILEKLSDNSLIFKGNAFLVNKKGLFLSAGHLFPFPLENCNNYYAAFPSLTEPTQLYSFRNLYHEYFNPLKAISEEELKRKRFTKYEDLFIGRLQNYKVYEYFKLKIKRPLKDELLSSKCYLRGAVEEFAIEQGKVDLSSLRSIPLNNYHPIKEREFSIISAADRDYEMDDTSRVDSVKKYNNCMWLKYSAGPGSSGSPVFDSNGRVVGIHLKGKQNVHWKHILCSKYIRKQYRHIKN